MANGIGIYPVVLLKTVGGNPSTEEVGSPPEPTRRERLNNFLKGLVKTNPQPVSCTCGLRYLAIPCEKSRQNKTCPSLGFESKARAAARRKNKGIIE